eukprot:TRINITY_DN5824_c0_g1_i1.p1 TRINITY_DN5824_c0_g1~~TRINITY_DN5824_c0_g1_i1.p1  ORF type:complete len:224 (-),score=42.51 TRINITY_DN5824_c0_g1_i1:95-766(-)
MRFGRDKDEKVAYIKNRLQRAREALRSIKVEFREMSKVESAPYQDRTKAAETRINDLFTDLEWAEKNESDKDKELRLQKMEDQKDYKKVLAEGAAIQSEDLKILQGISQTNEQTMSMGTEILGELSSQRETINRARQGVEQVESNLKMANRQARILARRLATDKIIMGFILLIVLGVLFIIIYSAVKPKVSGGGSAGYQLSPGFFLSIFIPILISTYFLGHLE